MNLGLLVMNNLSPGEAQLLGDVNTRDSMTTSILSCTLFQTCRKAQWT